MMFFYCQSYQAFNLALSYTNQADVTIITNSDNIVKACEFLKVKYLYHKNYNVNELIWNKKEVINQVNILINAIGKNELHFSHTQYAHFCFILVKYCNLNNNNVVFHNFEFVYNKIGLKDAINGKYLYLASIKRMLAIKYGLSLEIRKAEDNNYAISLNLDYIKKNCRNYIYDKDSYYNTTLNYFIKAKLDFPIIKNLFVGQFDPRINASNEKLDRCLELINHSENYIKMHPKLGKISALDKCKILPDFIPVELFFNCVNGNVISLHSASLITASKFKNIKAVSMVNLLIEKDQFVKQIQNDLTIKSNSEIIFPCNDIEFKEIVNDIK